MDDRYLDSFSSCVGTLKGIALNLEKLACELDHTKWLEGPDRSCIVLCGEMAVQIAYAERLISERRRAASVTELRLLQDCE
jgi:hypothetical protein